MAKQRSLVYTTDSGRLCPECEAPIDACVCAQKEPILGDGKVRISYETKGRKGKGMTLVKGLPLPASELKVIAKKLKQKVATGGAVKQGVIEVQGDCRDVLKTELKAMGWDAK